MHLSDSVRVEEDLEGVPDALEERIVVNADDQTESLRVVVGEHLGRSIPKSWVASRQ